MKTSLLIILFSLTFNTYAGCIGNFRFDAKLENIGAITPQTSVNSDSGLETHQLTIAYKDGENKSQELIIIIEQSFLQAQNIDPTGNVYESAVKHLSQCANLAQLKRLGIEKYNDYYFNIKMDSAQNSILCSTETGSITRHTVFIGYKGIESYCSAKDEKTSSFDEIKNKWSN